MCGGHNPVGVGIYVALDPRVAAKRDNPGLEDAIALRLTDVLRLNDAVRTTETGRMPVLLTAAGDFDFARRVADPAQFAHPIAAEIAFNNLISQQGQDPTA